MISPTFHKSRKCILSSTTLPPLWWLWASSWWSRWRRCWRRRTGTSTAEASGWRSSHPSSFSPTPVFSSLLPCFSFVSSYSWEEKRKWKYIFVLVKWQDYPPCCHLIMIICEMYRDEILYLIVSHVRIPRIWCSQLSFILQSIDTINLVIYQTEKLLKVCELYFVSICEGFCRTITRFWEISFERKKPSFAFCALPRLQQWD